MRSISKCSEASIIRIRLSKLDQFLVCFYAYNGQTVSIIEAEDVVLRALNHSPYLSSWYCSDHFQIQESVFPFLAFVQLR